MNKQVLILFFTLCLWIPSFGQVQRCVTEEIRNSTPSEPIDQFEFWMLQKKQAVKRRSSLRLEAVVQIPVVVHIIHNGEPLGTGINIDDQQILAQLQVINEDFRRTNPDASSTQAEFLPVAADFEIEFVMAKQDPEGLPTSGIVRVDGNQPSWSWAEQVAMKGLSYWPAEDYLNIWVSDLTGSGSSNVLGFAQYPDTSLPGVNFGGIHRLVDGVAIDYTVFGSEVYYPDGNYNSNFDRGRTLTHELGHFFGLRHIWGDGFSCGATDYCDDTPSQLNDTNGCPGSKSTCSSNDMFQNFMDYTNDVCMNIFSEDQKLRVQTVLSESPRRLSLISSHGLQDPVQFTNDGGILAVIAPGPSLCPGIFTPEIEIKNYGSVNLTSISVDFKVDGLLMENKTFTPNLAYLETALLTFNAIGAESKDYSFEITSVNGVSDENTLSNFSKVSVDVPATISAPFSEDFELDPPDWRIENPDDNITWMRQTAPFNSANNVAMVVKNYDYDALGELDYLVSPIMDLSTATAPFAHFDVAYAPYPGEDLDALMVGVIKNCDNTPSAIDTIYFKTAMELATRTATGSNFIPANSAEWRNESFLSLDEYIGMTQIQLIFISRAGYGNNIYVDNVQVATESELDISLSEVLKPGRYSCEKSITPTFEINNRGSETITSFTLRYQIDGGNFTEEVFSSLSIGSGDSYQASFNAISFAEGFYQLTAEVLLPNGVPDPFGGNNIQVYNFGVQGDPEVPPDRERFEIEEEIKWKAFSTNPTLNWAWYDHRNNGSIAVNSFNSGASLGDEVWLVSPAYDFTEVDKASILFDVAYSSIPAGSESLYLMVSRDCGSTFDEVAYIRSGANLSTADPFPNFAPQNDEWRNEFVQLNSYAGEAAVQFGFLLVNGSGNNLFLDNIELYIDDDPSPLIISTSSTQAYPNPTSSGRSNLTFNLEDKEDISIFVFDSMGRRVYEKQVSNVLNQTVELDLRDEPKGIYIVRIVGKTLDDSFRLMLAH